MASKCSVSDSDQHLKSLFSQEDLSYAIDQILQVYSREKRTIEWVVFPDIPAVSRESYDEHHHNSTATPAIKHH